MSTLQRNSYETCKKYLETKDKEGCVHFIQEFQFTAELVSRPNTNSLTIVPDTRKLHSIATVPKKWY